jgi:hypothetical protein
VTQVLSRPVTQISLESITWLPRAGMTISAQELSSYELEQAWSVGYHTLRTLTGCRNPQSQWPTVRLWQGYETALTSYLSHLFMEIRGRGLSDQLEYQLLWAIVEDAPKVQSGRVWIDRDMTCASTRQLQRAKMLPPWFGWRPLHQSHRMALQTGDLMQIRWPWEKHV